MGIVDFHHGWNVQACGCGHKYAEHDKGACTVCSCLRFSRETPTYKQDCMGLLVCPHCGKSTMCSNVQSSQIETTGDNDTMIPRGNSNSGNNDGRGKRKGTGLRYLSAEMLSTAHQLATIVAARMEPDTFRRGQDSLVCKLKFRGEFILWTLREGNPSLETIADALGDDETKWSNAEIELYLEEDDFNGKKWIRAEVVQTVDRASEKPGKRGK